MYVSGSQEDYLKIIWYMEQDQVKATAKSVADRYRVKPPTVLAMFKQLSQMELIHYDKLNGAQLTETGDNQARKLIRKHRLVETFLEEVLEMDNHLLHEEAERLEHAISDNLMYRIDAYLGFPETDPHGSPIPGWNPHFTPVLLKELSIGDAFRVQEIIMNEEQKKFYADRNFIKGSTWSLYEKTPDNAVYTVTNGTVFLAFSERDILKVRVQVHY